MPEQINRGKLQGSFAWAKAVVLESEMHDGIEIVSGKKS
jgi:hypothetical protein